MQHGPKHHLILWTVTCTILHPKSGFETAGDHRHGCGRPQAERSTEDVEADLLGQGSRFATPEACACQNLALALSGAIPASSPLSERCRTTTSHMVSSKGSRRATTSKTSRCSSLEWPCRMVCPICLTTYKVIEHRADGGCCSFGQQQ